MSPRLEQALPKYVQIANYLRDRIAEGELRPGDEVPSERQIAEEFDVARPTATRALATLRSWGLVESRPGSGTFVRAQPQLYRRARDRYAQSRATGRAYTSGEWSEIVAAELVPATEDAASALGIDAGSAAARRRRVIYDHGGPVEVATSWFTSGRLARDRQTARLATPEEAATLRLGEDPAAVLLIHHVTYDDAGEPLEFAEAVYPGGRWTFEDEYPIG